MPPKNEQQVQVQLESNEIHIWSTDLSTTTREEENQHFLLLNPDERLRAERFHFPIHKKRFITARTTLRQILSIYLGIPPEEIIFTYSEHEKPALLIKSPLQFNLSHSHDLAVYALTLDHAIGVDIEMIKNTYKQEVAERYFSPRENADLNQLPEKDQARGFYSIWARKEAIIKAIGKGLAMPLSTFSVSIHNNHETIALENETWTLASLPLHQDYQSALATNQMIKKISYWRFFNQAPKLDKVSFL